MAKHRAQFSYRRYAWRQFRKNKPALLSLFVLLFIFLLALSADIIATSQPWYAVYRGKAFYPAFSARTHTDSTINPRSGNYERIQFDITDWRSLPLEDVVWAPIPYSSTRPDIYNRNYTSPTQAQHYKDSSGRLAEAPFRLRHHMGTDQRGIDVASGLIHGAGISLRVGIVSMGIASIIGLLLGSLAGYFGDSGARLSRAQAIGLAAGTLLGYFWGFVSRHYTIADALDSSILQALWQIFTGTVILLSSAFIFTWLGGLLGRRGILSKKIFAPIDVIISRFTDILDTIPNILLIITIAAIFQQKSLMLVMAIIGFTSWTGIARLTRAEMLRIRHMDYIQAARALGYPHRRIMLRHALPNALAPIFVSIAFGVASAILAESALSFLGIGVPPEVVTWGSLLSEGRLNISAWWMVVFPGAAIFITVTVYNLIGDGLRDALDPRLKD